MKVWLIHSKCSEIQPCQLHHIGKAGVFISFFIFFLKLDTDIY